MNRKGKSVLSDSQLATFTDNSAKQAVRTLTANPFDLILDRLDELEAAIREKNIVDKAIPAAEFISSEELCARLNITKPTVIRWRKKGKIPFTTIGSSVRFNWPKVVEQLSKS